MTQLEQRLYDYYVRYYRDTLGLPEWDALARARTHEEDDEQLRVNRLEDLIGPLRGRSVLSVGCGTGGFAVTAAKRGARVVGIDPDEPAVVIARDKAGRAGLTPKQFQVGVAERLPYPDTSFDVVHCYTVLEHVADVDQSMREMLRVAKSSGIVYVHSPNYLHAYEGHYKLFWPPLLPKPLGRWYLRSRGRPTAFLDTLNYLTPGWVRRAAERAGGQVQDVAERGAAQPGASLMARAVAALERVLGIRPHVELVVRKRG